METHGVPGDPAYGSLGRTPSLPRCEYTRPGTMLRHAKWQPGGIRAFRPAPPCPASDGDREEHQSRQGIEKQKRVVRHFRPVPIAAGTDIQSTCWHSSFLPGGEGPAASSGEADCIHGSDQSTRNRSPHGRTSPKSQMVGWRLTCPICGDLFRDADGRELPSPFWQYRDTAILGEQLLDNEAELGIATWASPAEIARLLLMRRILRPVPRAKDLWRFRVLGAIIPDLDGIIAVEQENLPTPASPILRLHMRPALLAGIAIVERAGPEMLRMLRRHMMGDNKFRFTETTERIIAQARWPRSLQMQLI